MSDLFAGLGAQKQADLKAQGLDISAYGNLIKAQGDLADVRNTTSPRALRGRMRSTRGSSSPSSSCSLTGRSVPRLAGSRRARSARG